mgnify:CR=1 FL=1
MKRLVNPNVLRWARERLRLSPEDVEKEAKRLRRRQFAPVSARNIRDWERGRGEPSLAQMETLAEVYVCPIGYFFLDRPPEEKLPETIFICTPEDFTMWNAEKPRRRRARQGTTPKEGRS